MPSYRGFPVLFRWYLVEESHAPPFFAPAYGEEREADAVEPVTQAVWTGTCSLRWESTDEEVGAGVGWALAWHAMSWGWG